MIFKAYNKTDLHLNWCDPDTGYEDDVRAFVEALEEYCGSLPSIKTLYRLDIMDKALDDAIYKSRKRDEEW